MIKYLSVNIPQNRYQNRLMNNLNVYKPAVEKIKQKAARDICENAYYQPIEEIVQNIDPKFYSKTLKVRIVQDEEDFAKHFVEAVISTNSSPVEITRPVLYGDKNTVLKLLSESSVLNKLSEDFDEMSAGFKK